MFQAFEEEAATPSGYISHCGALSISSLSQARQVTTVACTSKHVYTVALASVHPRYCTCCRAAGLSTPGFLRWSDTTIELAHETLEDAQRGREGAAPELTVRVTPRVSSCTAGRVCVAQAVCRQHGPGLCGAAPGRPGELSASSGVAPDPLQRQDPLSLPDGGTAGAAPPCACLRAAK